LRSLTRVLMIVLQGVLLLQLPACYHMRAEPELIATRSITITVPPLEAVKKIRRLAERTWKCRILETDSSGTVLITAPYHFTTETGFGQPAGGRKYYTQLKIDVHQLNGTTTVQISHYNFEIRTSYAYTKDGEVHTMYKHYPYEKYPGMFDLTLINNEMDRVALDISRLFQEYR
jgi:hypothetical protein